ncbi:hypothetical protein [Acidovorax cavernicola]|uniref:Alpha/beta hydrolase n=1 Tax=Acidovorax cavernicola TaxID=1675792 RepID=A0A9X8D991_9BURK|nr:hypothetical protein [Acidovorax cavernicola]RIX84818.1 hypothetical protein D3H34_04135 [Acidovorax cavernicola]
MNDLMQTPHRFGPGDALMGMLTVPAQQVPAPVACLMFNMGANHRVGPRRINVKLAHVLAARGVSSLRFDLGGVGDSDALDTGPDLQTRAVHSLQAAMDLAQGVLGIRQFAVVAMCSGVEHAMSAAAVDARLVALSLFDGFAFPQRRTRWELTVRRALAVPMHPSFPGKARRWVLRHLPGSTATRPLPGYFADRRPPDVNAIWFEATMKRLVEREVAVQLLYSGSLHVRDRDRDQLGALCREPFMQGLQYEFMRDVDHTVCTVKGQQLFLQSVGDWVAEHCLATSSPQRHSRPAAGTPRAIPATLAAP